MVPLVRLCLSLTHGTELPAGQLVDIWHVLRTHCPEACGAPAVCQWEVRHGIRQPLNRWQDTAWLNVHMSLWQWQSMTCVPNKWASESVSLLRGYKIRIGGLFSNRAQICRSTDFWVWLNYWHTWNWHTPVHVDSTDAWKVCLTKTL